ncbi:MAG: NfeD family protein [Spirochaetaceae bacterium]|jgi:membrane-bound ClpP family serine protease|nr:NfeD family protein [Spirochaetaceae bacterium]
MKQPKSDKALIGKIAIVASPLIPSGTVEADGEIYDAISQESNIESGRGVRAVGIKGSWLLVHLV